MRHRVPDVPKKRGSQTDDRMLSKIFIRTSWKTTTKRFQRSRHFCFRRRLALVSVAAAAALICTASFYKPEDLDRSGHLAIFSFFLFFQRCSVEIASTYALFILTDGRRPALRGEMAQQQCSTLSTFVFLFASNLISSFNSTRVFTDDEQQGKLSVSLAATRTCVIETLRIEGRQTRVKREKKEKYSKSYYANKLQSLRS